MVCEKSMNIRKQARMSRSILYILFLHLLILSGCAPAMYDASFKGKVIDDDTKEPIEGAVALAIWTTWMATPAGEVDQYYDAYETVTDKNGEFYLPGKGPRVASNLDPMQVTVLKAGYMVSSGTRDYYASYSLNKNSREGRLTVPLRKLSSKQRKMRGIGPSLPPDEAPIEKVNKFLLELNKDRIERGLTPIKQWGAGGMGRYTIFEL